MILVNSLGVGIFFFPGTEKHGFGAARRSQHMLANGQERNIHIFKHCALVGYQKLKILHS